MAQRNSGYARKPRDFYVTPEWVTLAIAGHIPEGPIWECAAGTGEMGAALRKAGRKVVTSDIHNGIDFLKTTGMRRGSKHIVTNPPFNLAREFIEHALNLTAPGKGSVTLLLPVDYDSAKTRWFLFGENEVFDLKLVLTSRIRWFANTTGSPSANHAWYHWNWDRVVDDPKVRYHYREAE